MLSVESPRNAACADPALADQAMSPENAGPPVQSSRHRAPLRYREIAAVALLVALCDVVIYRGHGFAGYALLFLAAPALLLLGSARPNLRASFWAVFAMLLLLAARMIWIGSGLATALGFALLVAFAMALAGRRPYVLDVLVYALQTSVAGGMGLAHYKRSAGQLSPRPQPVAWLNLGMPVAALAIFGVLFVLANPDLVTSVVETARWTFRSLQDWAVWLSPGWLEVLLWGVVIWVAIGLLRPVLRGSVLDSFSQASRSAPRGAGDSAEAPLYAAIRNTLAALIGLFAVYLAFEFKTLWFHRFPKGFYYAGYAHEGAAWLTAALAAATVVHSLIFRGRILRDPRLARLRRWAWIWSAENLILALAVYNRLYIYVGFNGMTRMRMVGIFGISTVVVGFILVVWKVVYQRDFVWLLHRQLWALAVAVYLFALTPVDAIVHTYNVRRVLAGDLAPSVQISVHPINAEGVLVLHPLVHSDHAIIREGIRALMAERVLEAEAVARERERQDWTTFQLADALLLTKLQAIRGDWAEYVDPSKRYVALDRFHKYAYQWY